MNLILNLLNELAILGVAFLAAVVVVTVYEYAHAFTSWRLGDRLPKVNRRLTLNPIPHIDIVGILFFIGTGFGWGNPVETSPKSYKDKKKGIMLVGVSGIAASLILAIISCTVLQVIKINTISGNFQLVGYGWSYLIHFVTNVYYFGFYLAVISLIPMYPYDGFMVWGKVISPKNQFKIFRYQSIMLTVFLFIVLFSPDVLKIFIEPLRTIIEKSIYGIVNLIL